jgi:hypothetical protein
MSKSDYARLVDLLNNEYGPSYKGGEPPYSPTMSGSDPTRNNHGGDIGSEMAFESGDKNGWVEATFAVILKAGYRGRTPEEVAKILGVTVLTIRPRFTTLLKDGRIVKTHQWRRSQLGGRSRVCCASGYGVPYVDRRKLPFTCDDPE